MAVIRQAQAQRIASDALVLDLGDLARQGQAITQRARAEAQAIVQEAHRTRENLLRDAGSVGHAQGLEQGKREGIELGKAKGRQHALAERKAALALLEKNWGEALAQFTRERDNIIQESKDDVLRLAIVIASSVVKRAIEVDASLVQDQMRAVVSLVMRPTSLVLCVHPEDEAIVREALPALAREGLEHVTLAADPSLARGSCIARTRSGGVIDASIRTQLDRMAQALLPGETAERQADA